MDREPREASPSPQATPPESHLPVRRPTRHSAAALCAAAALLLSIGCATVPRGAAEQSWLEYLDTARRLQAQGPSLEPGSEEARRAVERFQRLLSDYKAPGFQAGIREVYAEEVFFNDTLKTLRGVDEVEEHFAATAEAVDSGTVEFVDSVSDDGDYYFRWVMKIRFKRFARGEETLSIGMSHVRFDAHGKVVLHQDFWDSVGGLFEHTPALGWVLRRAKSKL